MFRIRPLRLAGFRAILDQIAEEAAHYGESGLGRELKNRLTGCWPIPPVFPSAQARGEPHAERPRGAASRSGGAFGVYAQEAAAAGPPREPAAAPRSEMDEVAEELRLSLGLTPAELCRRRREFARSHHPDRVPERQRERATRRMSIANALIDGALRSRPRS